MKITAPLTTSSIGEKTFAQKVQRRGQQTFHRNFLFSFKFLVNSTFFPSFLSPRPALNCEMRNENKKFHGPGQKAALKCGYTAIETRQLWSLFQFHSCSRAAYAMQSEALKF